jgi:hypothetical protein
MKRGFLLNTSTEKYSSCSSTSIRDDPSNHHEPVDSPNEHGGSVTRGEQSPDHARDRAGLGPAREGNPLLFDGRSSNSGYGSRYQPRWRATNSGHSGSGTASSRAADLPTILSTNVATVHGTPDSMDETNGDYQAVISTRDPPKIWGLPKPALSPLLATDVPSSASQQLDPQQLANTSDWDDSVGLVAKFMQPLGGVPKAALYAWYGKRRQVVVSQANYATWHDKGPPHKLKYTSVFCCPVTGEFYPSGRYGDPKYYTLKEDIDCVVVWYSKKAFAEHGAASRAYDCLVFRESDCDESQIGNETPYESTGATILHSSIPDEVGRQLKQLQQQIIEATQHSEMEVEDAVQDSEEEAPWQRPPPANHDMSGDFIAVDANW